MVKHPGETRVKLLLPPGSGARRGNCACWEPGKSQGSGRGLPGRTAFKEHSTAEPQGAGADEDRHLLPLAS